MSLTYSTRTTGIWFWLGAAVLSAGLHVALPAQMITFAAQTPLPKPDEAQGITGAILFDLSDIIAAPSAPDQEQSIAQEESKEAPTVTESPEVVETAKAADQPLLAQIPYEVDDESLKFAVAAPEPEAETEAIAEEIASEHDPEKVDAPSQTGAEDAQASVQSTTGMEAENQAETAKAKSEGLSAEQKAEIQEWQKSIVLMISKAKKYPQKARLRKVTGEVRVRFTLNKYGTVIATEVAKSSGAKILDDAAVKTVQDIGKMPTPPNYMSGEEFSLIIPLVYRLK